jgi:N-acylneuraminate cytidylyltransferase
MIRNKKVLAVIPARGGSKRVPRKNLRVVGNRPLIAWTIIEARKSRYIDQLIVSSEDREIIATAKEWGCDAPFERPPELARDDTPGVDTALHALEVMPGFAVLVWLQPTSPLRTVDDIDGCIEKWAHCTTPSVVSVTQADNPFWMYTLEDRGLLRPILQPGHFGEKRQSPPLVYMLNGAVYVADVGWLSRTRSFVTAESAGFVMPPKRSIDIDTEFDLAIFHALIAESNLANS